MGDKATLPDRVKKLGVNTRDIKRIELAHERALPITEFLNKPGQALSMELYMGIAKKTEDGTLIVGVSEAKKGLRFYGKQLRQETAAGANHPGVSLLENIAAGLTPPLKLEAIRHNKVETLTEERASVLRLAAENFGTPTYVYFESEFAISLDKFKTIPAPYGKTIRLAAKANTNGAILRWFYNAGGAGFDSCSVEEVERITNSGIPLKAIRLVSKQVPDKSWLKDRVSFGLNYVACSLRQLENFGEILPGCNLGVRFNIHVGSGFAPQVSTGGLGSPFGILYPEKKSEIDRLLRAHRLTLDTVHYHIGAGADPEKQKEALAKGLEIVKAYDTITTIDTGGSFKIARVIGEKETDIRKMGKVMASSLEKFAEQTGRKIHLEVEPGTALLGNAGYLVFRAIDKVDTGVKGETFVVLDGGMNCNSRIPLYGAQHPLYNLAEGIREKLKKNEHVIFVGPECESGSVATVRRGQPEVMDTRTLREVRVGDYIAMGGVGAYCGSSMTLRNYNSLADPAQVFVRSDGRIDLIRKRQALEDLWKDEIIPEDLR